ncbi:multiheme c-type cytochrome [Roseovarius sp.]|uniref:multiheme c-type cytochrome n=1 Tax=Roseovarius sp. TaxID=1486281 RepID=UPI000C610C5D|nr:multiheme c-type cytochrome [Roseovarius sp.]MAO26526.1 hypothetical protein [Roseovarius sp.]MAZ20154.1 hypothetical protein [Roseovarius sp.]
MSRGLGALILALCLMGSALAAQDYVGSDTCAECHRDAAQSWAGSHHALAWTAPSAESVKADFDGTEFQLGDMQARFSLGDDGSYQVSVTERDGRTSLYDVHSVAGVAPLQQFIIETEPGRLQSFDIVWDVEAGRWFHLYPAQNYAPDDALHWTGPYKTWNSRCASCHATGFTANYDYETRSFASTQAEIGVGCEACHGPGSEHVSWAEGLETTRSPPPQAHGFPVDMNDPTQMTEQCAGCHARREAFGDGNPEPGTPFHDAFNLSWLREGLYEADGQILDEVYVYGSFLQSKMYAKGVTCRDCHRPHQADLVAEDNTLCTQCHSPAGNPAFPSLPRRVFDGPAHTQHAAGSDGAQCRACHMVERTYMGNDLRADHSFRIPRPDLAEATGAPDACTGCHEDQTAAWAAERIAAWFPDSEHRGAHYGEVIAQGRRNPSAAAPALRGLAQDEEMAAIVRATALYLLERAESPEDAAELEQLLRDADPQVRAAAVRLQRLAPPLDRVPRVLPALSDPSKSVRIAAAQAMLGAPIAKLPGEHGKALRRAFAEWQSALTSRLDFPETHLQMGGAALTMRNVPASVDAFAEATRLDPKLVDAWIMRVRLAAATGDMLGAARLLQEALGHNPSNLSLALLHSELSGAPLDLLPPAE